MTATVLVALDGSDKDHRALPVAARLAHHAAGGVHLIHEFAGPGELRNAAAQNLREAAERVAPLVHRPVTLEVAEGHDVAMVLLVRREHLNADFVVMATRAPGAVGRAIHGSVADQ